MENIQLFLNIKVIHNHVFPFKFLNYSDLKKYYIITFL